MGEKRRKLCVGGKAALDQGVDRLALHCGVASGASELELVMGDGVAGAGAAGGGSGCGERAVLRGAVDSGGRGLQGGDRGALLAAEVESVRHLSGGRNESR